MSAASTQPIKLRHYVTLFVLAAIWSSSFMVIKVTVETVPPLTMTAARLIIAGLMLAVIMKLKGEELPTHPKVWIMSIFLGLFGNAMPFTLISWGEEVLPSSLASILMAVMPLATVLLAHFFSEGERLTGYSFLGIVIGFFGILILVGPSALSGLGDDLWRQVAVAGGAVSYAIATILARNMPPSPLLGRSVSVMICASVLLAPAAIAFDDPMNLTPDTTAIWGTFFLGVLPTGIATLIYFRLISEAGAGFLAYINYLIPVMGVIWGAVFLSEVISLQALIALGAILTGLFVANIRGGRG